ncbi:hypothetical protein ACFQ67_00055 [Streptomyces sp. NPDC056488]|uniref:hypothetical protein n=1 Tax=Streptomyces sp. NPDC056488 TaxID=3345836 RepID=UPI0036B85F52
MRRCQTCGYPIEGEAREIVPDSDSGARPTLYRHPTPDGCAAARRARTVLPPLRRYRRP